MNIGLIGAGRIGQTHVANIHGFLDGYRITHAYDPYVDQKWLVDNNIKKVDSLEELLQTDVECVLVCSPSPQHVPQIIAAAKAKKHIFCEKPIGLDLDEIEEAINIAQQQGVVLQVGFNRRFDPTFAKVKKDVEDKVGTPHIVRVTSRDPECPPESYVEKSGGIFLDMTIHDFDMVRFLAGSEVTEIFATGSCLINEGFAKYGDIDTAIVQLRFANGAIGFIDNSRQAVYGYDQRVEVFSNKACIKAENQSKNNIKTYSKDAISDLPLKNFFLDRYEDAFIDQFKAFFDSIENGAPVAVSGFDGLQAVKIAKAAQKSYETKSPVRL